MTLPSYPNPERRLRLLKPGLPLIRTSELKAGVCKAIRIRPSATSDNQTSISILIAQDEDHQVRAYLNMCPHQWVPLGNETCLKRIGLFKKKWILECANHYARFELENGECFDGVCKGQSLIAVPIEQADGWWVTDNL